MNQSQSYSLTHIFFTACTILLFLVLVGHVEARTVIRTGEQVSVAADQTVEGDFYAAASERLGISGVVTEDVVAAGGRVTVNGSVGGDVFILGGSVDMHGVADDDVRIIAGETVIAEPVNGDVFVIAGRLHILSTAAVTGDVIIYAGDAHIEGAVSGDVIGSIASLRIDGPIGGDVDVSVDELTLGAKSVVEGDVRYTSNQLVSQAQDAIVEGVLMRNDPIFPETEIAWLPLLVPLLILSFSTLAWFFVSRRSLLTVVEHTNKKPVRVVLVGVLSIMLLPILVAILFASMLGSLLALVLGMGYFLFVALSFIALPALLGDVLMKLFNQPGSSLSLVTILVGLVVLQLLIMLPVVGPVIGLVGVIVAFGALVDVLLTRIR